MAVVSPPRISTSHYLLDQARRRLTPTLNTIPGMGAVEGVYATTIGGGTRWPNRPPEAA